MASGQNSQLAQGALFLIDSTGPCPTGKKYRTFIDAAIAHHLTQHTYYYQDRGRPGAKNTKRATFRKFRNSLQALWENVKPESRGRKDRDRVEALFTLKSEAITPRALRTYGYDPETFSETDLPVFVDEGDDNLQPREQAQTASTPAPRSQQAHTSVPSPKRKSEFSDEPQQHATKRVRTEELIAETDRKDRTSHSSRSPQELVPAPLERMEEELQTSDGTQLQAAKRPRTSGNPVSDAGYKGSSARMPRCRPCIQSKKGCDRQRPCGRCRAAGIGVEGCIAAELPERGENQIATENNDTTSPSNRQINHSPPRAPQVPLPGPSTGSKRGLESSHEPQQQAAKRGRFDNPVEITEHGKPSMKLPRCKRCIQEDAVDCDRQRPCSNCKAAGIDRQGCAGAEQNSNLHVGVESDVSTTKNATRPRSTPQIQPNTKNYGPGMPHDPLVESESPNADDARASLGKRKRGPDDTGTAAGHGGVQTTSASDQSAPSKRQATASIVEASPADEHANLAAKLLEGTPSGASHAANDNTAAFANENIESDPLDDTLNPKPQPKPREITGSDLGAFSDSLKKSQKDVELAALAILACIGHISNILCPLDLKPSEHLAVLYVRCWGAEWKEVAVEALKRGGFRTPFVTMSLISAFLYDRILNQKAYNKELAQDFIKQLEESGPTGEAMLKALHWPKREPEIAANTLTIATEDARRVLAQDDAAVRAQLQTEAETLMREFWNITLPHFRAYVTMAETYGLSSGNSEEDLFKLFESSITPIIRETLHHKLELVASGCKYAYVWPSDGEKFVARQMNEFGARTSHSLVWYTICPGPKFDLPPSLQWPRDPMIPSWVMTRYDPSPASGTGSDASKSKPSLQ